MPQEATSDGVIDKVSSCQQIQLRSEGLSPEWIYRGIESIYRGIYRARIGYIGVCISIYLYLYMYLHISTGKKICAGDS